LEDKFFSKILFTFFCPQKVEKTTQKSCILWQLGGFFLSAALLLPHWRSSLYFRNNFIQLWPPILHWEIQRVSIRVGTIKPNYTTALIFAMNVSWGLVLTFLFPLSVIYKKGVDEKTIRREIVSICLLMFSSQ
jgi:hypothetical protein